MLAMFFVLFNVFAASSAVRMNLTLASESHLEVSSEMHEPVKTVKDYLKREFENAHKIKCNFRDPESQLEATTTYQFYFIPKTAYDAGENKVKSCRGDLVQCPCMMVSAELERSRPARACYTEIPDDFLQKSLERSREESIDTVEIPMHWTFHDKQVSFSLQLYASYETHGVSTDILIPAGDDVGVLWAGATCAPIQ
mmetsp:Transcript_6812/g.12972  ORF Transcript_6812/g.12972 Transcript_6812/m.12972 type:complete len:197 (-) Transcript_6812:15-605(-)